MVTTISRVSICFVLTLAVVPTAAFTREPLQPTVDGPEADNLVGKVTGYLITDQDPGIVAFSLPSLEKRVVLQLARDDEDDQPTIHAMSGPDSQARIAYIEDHYFVANEADQRHMLKTVQADGTQDTEIFSRPGDAMWATTTAGKGEIGSHLALAPTGGWVAFLSEISNRQMPRALLNVGRIEIWNVAEKTGAKTRIEAIDEPMSWFPDGKRLTYTKLVPRNELPQQAAGLDHFGNYFDQTWDEVPAIFVFNTQTKTTSFLYVGWKPIVSHDGNTVYVGGWGKQDYRWRSVDVQTSESQPITWPGFQGGLIAAPSDRLALYRGLPTTGARGQDTRNYMLTIKIAEHETNTFQTIVPFIDVRRDVSFGLRALNK